MQATYLPHFQPFQTASKNFKSPQGLGQKLSLVFGAKRRGGIPVPPTDAWGCVSYSFARLTADTGPIQVNQARNAAHVGEVDLLAINQDVQGMVGKDSGHFV
jgi:hypothetical protein